MKNKKLPAARQNKKLRLFLFLFLLTAGFFGSTRAAEKPLLISELMYSPDGTDAKHEWLEIYNPGSDSLDLSGWKLFEAGINHSLEPQQDSSVLEPGAYAVIADDAATFRSDHSSFAGTLFDSVFSLSISGETIAFKNILDETVLTFSYSNSWGADGTGKSLEKINLSGDDTKENWQESYLSGGTPGYENFTNADVAPEPVEYSDQVYLTELLPNPTGDFSEEFVEIYNAGESQENLLDWKLMDDDGYLCKFPELTLAPGQYLAVKKSSFSGCSIALSNNGDEIGLYDPAGSEPVSLAYYAEEAEPNSSWSLDGEDWRWAAKPTPGKKNDFNFPESPPEDPGDDSPAEDTPSEFDVRLSEILPNPKGADKSKEFIEIYNAEDSAIDLGDWKLQYSSKKYPITGAEEIGPGKYLVLHDHANFSFSLGNSGHRTLSLLDKDGKKASSVSYEKAKENVSLNFDGALWHWSRHLTPGKDNRLNRAPKIKIKKAGDAYVGVPLSFSPEAKDKDKDKLKFVWDFGDGHKSYLKKPTHLFTKSKKYKVTLTVDDGSEKFSKTLSLKVKKYPKQNVKIIQLSPNPAGNDTGQEKITLLNNEKKKINLKGWKVATGKNKKLLNHPIAVDFFIEAKKSAVLSRQQAYFALNNTAMHLELRYPDGKTADKVAYAKEKIADDEIYKKTNGQWTWIAPKTEVGIALTPAPANVTSSTVQYADVNLQNMLGKFSAEPPKENPVKKFITFKTTSVRLASSLASQGRVLGASTVNYVPRRSFPEPSPPERHWLLIFASEINQEINFLLNFALNH